jgi:molybdenum cofactor guanylyltransferase
MRTAGVVLVGGRSSRMGAGKAALEWHGSTLLRRTVGIVGRCVTGPVVVVRAPGQDLPEAAEAELVDDPVEGRGPLQGLAAGLAAVAARADVAFVCAVDLPLLHPALVRHVLAALAEAPEVEAAVPVVDGRRQPLAAAYRVSLAERAAALLDAGSAGPMALLARSAVRELDERALLADPAIAAGDPELEGLRDVDDPAAYRALRERPAPLVRVRSGTGPPLEVRAATLAAALAAAGVPPGARARVVGGPAAATAGPTTPLAAGDVVNLLGG